MVTGLWGPAGKLFFTQNSNIIERIRCNYCHPDVFVTVMMEIISTVSLW